MSLQMEIVAHFLHFRGSLCLQFGFHLVNNNKSIYEAQYPVWRDFSKHIHAPPHTHTHTHTQTHTCLHTSILTIQSLISWQDVKTQLLTNPFSQWMAWLVSWLFDWWMDRLIIFCSGWHGGRRCTLINREKSLTAAFKNGRLYLTHRWLPEI